MYVYICNARIKDLKKRKEEKERVSKIFIYYTVELIIIHLKTEKERERNKTLTAVEFVGSRKVIYAYSPLVSGGKRIRRSSEAIALPPTHCSYSPSMGRLCDNSPSSSFEQARASGFLQITAQHIDL